MNSLIDIYNRIQGLEAELAEHKKQNDLLQTWVKHHQKSIETGRDREHLMVTALKVYADSDNPWWVHRTRIVEGQTVYYIRNIKQLEELAINTLAKVRQ